MQTEPIKHHETHDSHLKWVKENHEKKKKTKQNKDKGAWVQLKHQAVPPGEVQFVETDTKEPGLLSCWSPFPLNSWLNV